MTRRFEARSGGIGWSTALVLALWGVGPVSFAAEPTKAAVAGFEAYAGKAEARLARQHGSATEFVVVPAEGSDGAARLRGGELVVERLSPAGAGDLPGAMLHDWRGTAFVPGGKAAEFERLLRDFNDYPRRFAPQVLAARVVAGQGDVGQGDVGQGDAVQAWMRVQQHHVITVTLDGKYDVRFARLDAQHGSSISRSTGIDEVERPGTRDERVLSASEEHGFLWRLNTYWSWEERDGGLFVQIESISLTRAIPTGLGWAVGPFVQSVPRESLEFTLRAACGAL